MFFIHRIIVHFNSIRMLHKIKVYGKNCKLSRNVYLKNPQYISLGNEVLVGSNSVIEAWDKYENEIFDPQIYIGNRVKINSKCHISAINSIFIGDDCLLGSNVLIVDNAHGNGSFDELSIPPVKRRLFSKGGIVIGERCWIGDNVVILSNVHIGDNVTIGANAVVAHDIPANCVAAGLPAKVIRKITE